MLGGGVDGHATPPMATKIRPMAGTLRCEILTQQERVVMGLTPGSRTLAGMIPARRASLSPHSGRKE